MNNNDPGLHTLTRPKERNKGSQTYHLYKKGEQMVIVVKSLKDVGRILGLWRRTKEPNEPPPTANRGNHPIIYATNEDMLIAAEAFYGRDAMNSKREYCRDCQKEK